MNGGAAGQNTKMILIQWLSLTKSMKNTDDADHGHTNMQLFDQPANARPPGVHIYPAMMCVYYHDF